MNTSPIKIALAANIIFLMISLLFLSNAYLGGIDDLSVGFNKTEKIEEKIKNETEVETLRRVSVLSLKAQNAAYEVADKAIEASSTAIKLFSIMFVFNILFLLSFLHRNKNKSNKNFKRTEGA